MPINEVHDAHDVNAFPLALRRCRLATVLRLRMLCTGLLLSAVLLQMPSFPGIAPGAHGGGMSGWFYSTPYSAKGRFVFVTKVSRRILRASVQYADRSWLYPRVEL